MDPNTALVRLRVIMGRILSGECVAPDKIDDAAELFEALDEWMMSGGFLPKDWARKRTS